MFNMSDIRPEEEVVWCTSDIMNSPFESTHKLYNKAVIDEVPFSLVFKLHPEKTFAVLTGAKGN